MSTQSAVSPVQRLQPDCERGTWNPIHPVERGISLLALVLLSPLFLLVAILIAVLSRSSPLVSLLRVGQFGLPLWTLKFRTMWPDQSPGAHWRLAEYIVDECGPEQKNSSDPRITSKFARFCRRFSIDELPQLVHVVRGEMSLVGPRPLTRRELDEHYGADATEILRAKPGITGLWQVTGRSRLTYGERRERDLFLVRHRSLRLYLTILLRTIPAVLTGKDGW